MLTNEYFDLFVKIVPQIGQYFEEFISNEALMEKIMEMFLHILHNVASYPKTAIVENYCCLLYDSSFYDDDESERSIKCLQENIEKVKVYLLRVEKYLWKNKIFSSQKGFNE